MRLPVTTAMLAGMAFASAALPQAQAHAPRHVRYVRHHAFHGAYHIRRFDQDEAEAEVHAQYFYRTPYLPYWVFP